MSKIALTPNASGTGVFTISSPATNTDRTLTLPDEAGSIVVNTATGIDVTGTVTADGLTVESATGAEVRLKNTDSDGASGEYVGKLHFEGSDSSSGASGVRAGIYAQYGSSFGYTSLDLLTSISGGSLKRAMNISGDGDISFYEDTGTTAKFFWDASAESLGIGTSSPSALVHIKQSDGTPSTGLKVVRYNNDNQYLSLWANSGARYFDAVGDSSVSSINIFRSSIDSGSTFTETMRIDSNGALLLNTTSRTGTSNFVVSANTDVANPMSVVNTKTGVGTEYAILFYRAGSIVGSVQTSLSATSYVTSSDYRLKTDAQPMTGASARVQALKPVNFEWISTGERVDGFLAHEAQAVVPECVTGTKDAMRDEEYEVTAAIAATYDEDGNELTAAVEAVMGTRSVPDMQGIDQSKLVPLLTAALQEALTEITALKVRVAALEAV
jgi:hypothetical protein